MVFAIEALKRCFSGQTYRTYSMAKVQSVSTIWLDTQRDGKEEIQEELYGGRA